MQLQLPATVAIAFLLAGFVAPLKPHAEFPEEKRCAALGNFVEAFASQRLPQSKVAVLQCEELVDPPGAPWLAATVSYTYKNMTRILQLCVRATRDATELTLSATGGACEDEYFTAFEKVEEEQAAGRSIDKLDHATDLEADPELGSLKPELLEWLAP